MVRLKGGDPTVFGRLDEEIDAVTEAGITYHVVPGITGMSAAWTATGQPVTWGDDIMTVLMGTLPEATLAEHMTKTDALVVMKIGRNLDKVGRALARAGRVDEAWLIEYAAMPQERVLPFRDAGDSAPYFSILLVHGHGRRP